MDEPSKPAPSTSLGAADIEVSHGHGENVWWRLIDGVLIVAALVVVKLAFELSPKVSLWQSATIMDLQSRLSPVMDPYDLPVVVFDISEIPPQQPTDSSIGIPVTPRKPITELLNAIADSNILPRAVALDIDVSGQNFAQDTANDADFMAVCERLRKGGVGVYFACGRSAFEPLERLAKPLSADVMGNAVRGSVPWRLPVLTIAPGQDKGLPSLGARLAAHYQDDHDHAPKGNLLWSSLSKVQYKGVGTVEEQTIDLSQLAGLMASRIKVFKGDERAAARTAASRFNNAVVLIGDGTLRAGGDGVMVSAFPDKPVPGIYFHACSVVTALHGHLYELTHTGRILADIGISLGVLFLVQFICSVWSHGGPKGEKRVVPNAVHWLVTGVAVVLIIICGYWLVPFTRVLWIDFDLVALVLILHGPVEHGLHGLIGAIQRAGDHILFRSRGEA